MRARTLHMASACVLAVAMAGCSSHSGLPDDSQIAEKTITSEEGGKPMKIEVTSTAFVEGQPIPARHACEGEDLSPPLALSGVPEGTRELALICDDPDAPSPRNPGAEPWVHWVLYKIPAGTTSLPEGVATTPTLESPAGSRQGNNSWPSIGYRGPAPPPGSGTHRYFFKAYALDTELTLAPKADKAALLGAITGHVIGEGQLMGTYER